MSFETRGRKEVDDMTQEELDRNWELASAQVDLLTREEAAMFVDEGGVMFGLIERLVADGVGLMMWAHARIPSQTPG